MMKRIFAGGLVTALAVFGAVRADAQATTAKTGDVERPSAETVLEQALANYYAGGFARVRLINYHGKTKGIERELKVWIKGGSILGVFTKSAAIRGTSFLVLPPPDEKTASGDSVSDNQYFIYMPAFGRLRRISGAQRADSFFGTYLSQGDVEPHTASDFVVDSMRRGMLAGESVDDLTVTPRFDAGYDRASIAVATRDDAVLRIREYDKGRKTPIRVIETRRDWLKKLGDRVLPSELLVSEGDGDGVTKVLFSDRNLHPGAPDSMFTTSYLLRTGH